MNRAIASGVASNVAGLVLTTLITIVLTPIVIHGLGAYYYGLFILVSSLIDYCGVLDLGLRTTLPRFTARFAGRGEQAELDRTLVTSLAFAGASSLVVVAAAFAVAFLFPALLRVGGDSLGALRALAVLLAVSFLLNFPARIVGAYLCGLRRFDMYNLANLAAVGFRAALMVAVLRLGYGVVAVAWVTVAAAAVSLGLNLLLLFRARPETRLSPRLASYTRLKELIQFSVFVFLSATGDQMRSNLTGIIVARWLSVAVVTPFSVAVRLIEYFKLAIFTVLSPLIPAMSELEGKRQRPEMQALFLESTKVTMLLSCWMGALLVLDGRALLRVWLGPELLAAYPTLAVLAVVYTAALGQTPSLSVLYACGRHRAAAYWTLAEVVLSFALCVAWVRYGLVGVAWGLAAPVLATKLVVQPLYVSHVLRMPVGRYFRRAIARPAAATLLWLGACAALGRGEASSLAGLAWTVAWQSGLFAAAAYGVALSGTERQRLLRFAQQAHGRFRGGALPSVVR